MEEKIWWKCNACGYLVQQEVGKEFPKPCPACNTYCTFTNVTCYKPDCGGPQSGNIDPSLTSTPVWMFTTVSILPPQPDRRDGHSGEKLPLSPARGIV